MQETPQIAEKWRRFKKTGCQKTRAELADHYLPVLDACSRSITRRTPLAFEWGDIYGAASVGYMQAIDGFAPERGLKFTTYAEARMRGAVKDWSRAVDRGTRRMRERGEVPNFHDIQEQRHLPAPERVVRTVHNRLAAGAALSHTTAGNAYALVRAAEGLSDPEIGREVGKVSSAMCLRRQRGCDNIQAMCRAADYVWE
jgi:RNA polymerase sigma factor (sigma-70 family)